MHNMLDRAKVVLSSIFRRPFDLGGYIRNVSTEKRAHELKAAKEYERAATVCAALHAALLEERHALEAAFGVTFLHGRFGREGHYPDYCELCASDHRSHLTAISRWGDPLATLIVNGHIDLCDPVTRTERALTTTLETCAFRRSRAFEGVLCEFIALIAENAKIRKNEAAWSIGTHYRSTGERTQDGGEIFVQDGPTVGRPVVLRYRSEGA
jgi:hypothetical protein